VGESRDSGADSSVSGGTHVRAPVVLGSIAGT
jgi:hypothetical protein